VLLKVLKLQLEDSAAENKFFYHIFKKSILHVISRMLLYFTATSFLDFFRVAGAFHRV